MQTYESSETSLFIKKTKTKKKVLQKEEIEFKPSQYQIAIFDYIKHDNGNLIIEACSGSGKTTTIIKCLSLIDDNLSKLFVAFNKAIVKNIESKTKGIENIEVKTVHSIGYRLLSNMVGAKQIKINEFKYSKILGNKSFRKEFVIKKKKFFNKFLNNVKILFHYSRCNLCDNFKEISALSEKYDLDLVGNEIDIVLKLLAKGKKILNEFDYTDMIWLPNVLHLSDSSMKYDYILVDEMQDINIAQLKLILSLFKLGSRGIFVGDEYQLIYGFAGTDKMSFEAIKRLPNTKSLPLSISYRCSKKIVEYVKDLSPNIEAYEKANEGAINHFDTLADAQDGDAVICRNNAPLIKAYIDLLSMHKNPIFIDNDIVTDLIYLVENTKANLLNKSLTTDGVFSRLYYNLFSLRNFLMEKHKVTKEDVYENNQFVTLYDSILTLELLSNGLNTAEELINKIKSIYNKKNENGIILTSAHKSKGLEFNNVFIICDSLLGQKKKNNWETEQERNLKYVAYTRSKNNLNIINEKGYEKYLKNTSTKYNALNTAEMLVTKLYSLNDDLIFTDDNDDLIDYNKIIKQTNNILPQVKVTAEKKIYKPFAIKRKIK